MGSHNQWSVTTSLTQHNVSWNSVAKWEYISFSLPSIKEKCPIVWKKQSDFPLCVVKSSHVDFQFICPRERAMCHFVKEAPYHDGEVPALVRLDFLREQTEDIWSPGLPAASSARGSGKRACHSAPQAFDVIEARLTYPDEIISLGKLAYVHNQRKVEWLSEGHLQSFSQGLKMSLTVWVGMGEHFSEDPREASPLGCLITVVQ